MPDKKNNVKITEEQGVVRAEATEVAVTFNLETGQFDVQWRIPGVKESWQSLNSCFFGVHVAKVPGGEEVEFKKIIPLDVAKWERTEFGDKEFGGIIPAGLVNEPGLRVSGTSNLIGGWKIDFIFPTESRCLLARLCLSDSSREMEGITSLTPFSWTASRARGGYDFMGKGANKWRVFSNGYQSWSVNHLFEGTDKDKASPVGIARRINHMDANEVNPSRGKKGNFTSDWVTNVFNPSEKLGLVLGFATSRTTLGRLVVEIDPGKQVLSSLVAHAFLDPADTKAAPVESDWVFLSMSGPLENPFVALVKYSKVAGALMGARKWPKVPVGWCSWYYYYGDVTEEDLLRNLQFFEQHTDDLPVDFFQLDDGYQSEIGDWTTLNDKFPHGMRWLTDKIRAAGIKPGIWVAPFLVSPKSRVFKEHPDWVLRDAAGKPKKAILNWGKWQFSLDPTNPEVCEHLKAVFDVICREWGFDFVKIDFIYSVAVRGVVYHDPSATRASAYRVGVETVRKAMGSEKFLLGCGAPLLPCVGLVDAMRVGPDTKAKWYGLKRVGKIAKFYAPSLYPALESTILRSFYHGHLWINDPDCLIVRGKGDKSDLTEAEIQTELVVFGMSNGQVLLSDNMANLSEERVNLLRTIVPPLPLGEMAVPLDWMEGKIPSLLHLPLQREFGEWSLLSLVNWGSKPLARVLRLDPAWGFDPSKKYVIYEFWTRRFVGTVKGGQEFSTGDIPAHGCELYRVTPLSEYPTPLVCGTTLHFSQGAVEVSGFSYDAANGEATLKLAEEAGREGFLTMYIPASISLSTISPRCEISQEKVDSGAIIWLRLPAKAREIKFTFS
ncbi:MAG: glycoside hydrolase family 36 protein [Promethearchaeota archaeon]